MASYENVDYGSPDGALFGETSSSKIGFYGTTPAVQGAALTTLTTASSTTATPFGYTTAAQADAIVAAINTITAKFTALGLTA
jgi:UDP-N-acetyl-D-mannosaminuronic acid transferase (WecB/TagA/CpsF family)